MSREEFDLSGLVTNAEAPKDIIRSDRYGSADDEVPSGPTIRCAICGIPEEEANQLPIGYSNPVCRDCGEFATDEAGDNPWVGWPPGERPKPKSGTIQLAPDAGANPVYIAGVKCWRRYRFGGYITRRDAFDCNSVEEFTEKHRVEPGWIHAFNTPHPKGVDISREQYDEYRSLVNDLEKLSRTTQRLLHDPYSTELLEILQAHVDDFDEDLQSRLPDKAELNIKEYAKEIYLAVKREKDHVEKLTEFCERYYSEV
ncbi:hypothetical protein [Haloprofundus halophilus]|uniref:hypothetical protein n=1 Tax=Haloprofundus halophilus TaxID=2283527 RepID=UPI0013004C42|nr:hypothetical protein [Haloprofundus halophilus]